MPEKRQAEAQSMEDTRGVRVISITLEEIAEERITEWKYNNQSNPSFRRLGVSIHDILDLHGLKLKKVPDTLREVRDLQLLNLSDNNIQRLPQWIGELSALRGIDLSRNHLQTLPLEIGSLPDLMVLLLHENQLETLPETLRTLPLHDLTLHGNPKLGLPASILGRPPEEILRYYFESRDEKGRPLLELKLLLVGRGGSGKTTLVKRLAGEEPDAHEPETHSIAIRELTLACPRGQVRTRA